MSYTEITRLRDLLSRIGCRGNPAEFIPWTLPGFLLYKGPNNIDRKARVMAPRNTDPVDYDSLDVQWEEVGDDNGEIVAFEKGTVMFGTYVQRNEIELPEDKIKDDGKLTATLYVFTAPDSDMRWSAWETYQLSKAMEKVGIGDFVRIECTGERRAKEGSVKLFSVKRRIS